MKRRPLAALLCDNGYVTVNGREAPPGRAVKPGDVVAVRYAQKVVTVRVESLPGRGPQAGPFYAVLSEEAVEE